MSYLHAAADETPIPAEEAQALLDRVEASHRLSGTEHELTEDERELVMRRVTGGMTHQEFLDETRRRADAIQAENAAPAHRPQPPAPDSHA